MTANLKKYLIGFFRSIIIMFSTLILGGFVLIFLSKYNLIGGNYEMCGLCALIDMWPAIVAIYLILNITISVRTKESVLLAVSNILSFPIIAVIIFYFITHKLF